MLLQHRIDLLGRRAAVALLEVHHQEQLELRVAHGQVVTCVGRLPGQKLGELRLAPLVDVDHQPRLVAGSEVVLAQRLFKPLQHGRRVVPVGVRVLREPHRDGRPLERGHA